MNESRQTPSTAEIRAAIARQAREMLNNGYHCSEAVLLATTPHLVPDWHRQYARIATPFAGGTGGTQQELCGALSGGMMTIGALLGRVEAGVNDDAAQQLAAEFRRRFREAFGDSQCERVRRTAVKGPGGLGSCSVLVEHATALFLELMVEAGYELLPQP
jgi:C_GCAxxG_C_C family probable redox protein